jgi:predicted MFS family arabinose efflux permease
MFSRRLKTWYFILEGLNSFAVVYYFYYFYFFMQKAFGYGNQANLTLAAVNGATYALCAWAGGKFAQRFGYFTALKVGFVVMMSSLAIGLRLSSARGHIAVMVSTVVGMSFTWPTLEALVSEDEPREGLQEMVGVYNVVWAATAAVASFTGGAMLEKLSLASLFYVPIIIQVMQLGLTFWLEYQAGPPPRAIAGVPGAGLTRSQAFEPIGDAGMELPVPASVILASVGSPQKPIGAPVATQSWGTSSALATNPEHPPMTAKTFLRMAWFANPFAYIAINTLIAAMPGVADRLGLSTMLAGFCGSVWCFARLGAFIGLWLWSGWHYRFRWLLAAYLVLVGTFTTILLAPNLALLVSAQVLFGGALGLIYYSSLFYSMDRSETKGEHGGIHETVIGLGNFAGPATGAVALYLLPQFRNSGALAVSFLLLCGLGGLTAIWRGRPGA